MYLAAMAYNLKKYLRAAAPQQPASAAIALPLPGHLSWSLVLFCNSHECYAYPSFVRNQWRTGSSYHFKQAYANTIPPSKIDNA